MDAVDLDSLAWRVVELEVQRRHDPRLIVATRPTIPSPASAARLVAGLCNAAAGRRVIALFGLDGTAIVGVDEVPDETWLDTIAARFPGIVPTLAAATIDADGAHIVALTADAPGTFVIASRAGRAIIPWFDGTLADRPPHPGTDRWVAPPPGRLEVRSGWLELGESRALDPVASAGDTDRTPPGAGGATDTTARAADVRGAGDRDSCIGVWRGFLDVGLERDALIEGRETATATGTAGDLVDRVGGAGRAGVADARSGHRGAGPQLPRHAVSIADRDVSVVLLADGSAGALSLDVEVHPTPGTPAAVRADGGAVLDPLVPCRLYLVAAVAATVFDRAGDLGESVRLLVSLRFPDADRLVVTMATLRRQASTETLRWMI